MSLLPISTDIPAVFAAFYREVREVGYDVMFVFLVLALIREFILGIEGRSHYASLFVRVLLIAGLYAIYTPFFEEISRGMDLLSNFIMPAESFKEQIQKIFTAYKENHDLGMIALLKMTIMDGFMHASYTAAYVIFRAFAWVRVIFLSALYISGPILLGIGIFQPGMARIWIRWLFEVLSWNAVMSLFVRILVELNFFEFYTRLGVLNIDLIAMNTILIILILFFVPKFASLLIRGAEGFTEAGGRVLQTSARTLERLTRPIFTPRQR